MFCVLFCGLNGMFTSSPMASEHACALPSREKYYFSKQNILLVMFYRHNKTLKKCNFRHFLKAEKSEDSLANLCEEFRAD